MAYTDQKMSGGKVVAIVIVVLIHAALGYAFVTGLAYQYVKKATEKLNTFDVQEPPPPPPPEEPPPPPPPEQPNVDQVRVQELPDGRDAAADRQCADPGADDHDDVDHSGSAADRAAGPACAAGSACAACAGDLEGRWPEG